MFAGRVGIPTNSWRFESNNGTNVGFSSVRPEFKLDGSPFPANHNMAEPQESIGMPLVKQRTGTGSNCAQISGQEVSSTTDFPDSSGEPYVRTETSRTGYAIPPIGYPSVVGRYEYNPWGNPGPWGNPTSGFSSENLWGGNLVPGNVFGRNVSDGRMGNFTAGEYNLFGVPPWQSSVFPRVSAGHVGQWRGEGGQLRGEGGLCRGEGGQLRGEGGQWRSEEYWKRIEDSNQEYWRKFEHRNTNDVVNRNDDANRNGAAKGNADEIGKEERIRSKDLVTNIDGTVRGGSKQTEDSNYHQQGKRQDHSSDNYISRESSNRYDFSNREVVNNKEFIRRLDSYAGVSSVGSLARIKNDHHNMEAENVHEFPKNQDDFNSQNLLVRAAGTKDAKNPENFSQNLLIRAAGVNNECNRMEVRNGNELEKRQEDYGDANLLAKDDSYNSTSRGDSSNCVTRGDNKLESSANVVSVKPAECGMVLEEGRGETGGEGDLDQWTMTSPCKAPPRDNLSSKTERIKLNIRLKRRRCNLDSSIQSNSSLESNSTPNSTVTSQTDLSTSNTTNISSHPSTSNPTANNTANVNSRVNIITSAQKWRSSSATGVNENEPKVGPPVGSDLEKNDFGGSLVIRQNTESREKCYWRSQKVDETNDTQDDISANTHGTGSDFLYFGNSSGVDFSDLSSIHESVSSRTWGDASSNASDTAAHNNNGSDNNSSNNFSYAAAHNSNVSAIGSYNSVSGTGARSNVSDNNSVCNNVSDHSKHNSVSDSNVLNGVSDIGLYNNGSDIDNVSHIGTHNTSVSENHKTSVLNEGSISVLDLSNGALKVDFISPIKNERYLDSSIEQDSKLLQNNSNMLQPESDASIWCSNAKNIFKEIPDAYQINAGKDIISTGENFTSIAELSAISRDDSANISEIHSDVASSVYSNQSSRRISNVFTDECDVELFPNRQKAIHRYVPQISPILSKDFSSRQNNGALRGQLSPSYVNISNGAGKFSNTDKTSQNNAQFCSTDKSPQGFASTDKNLTNFTGRRTDVLASENDDSKLFESKLNSLVSKNGRLDSDIINNCDRHSVRVENLGKESTSIRTSHEVGRSLDRVTDSGKITERASLENEKDLAGDGIIKSCSNGLVTDSLHVSNAPENRREVVKKSTNHMTKGSNVVAQIIDLKRVLSNPDNSKDCGNGDTDFHSPPHNNGTQNGCENIGESPTKVERWNVATRFEGKSPGITLFKEDIREKSAHSMTAAEIIASCAGKAADSSMISTSIISSQDKKVLPPPPPHPPLELERLNLESPSLLVETLEEAHSREVENFCFSHPLAVVRNLAGALGLDLGLFSSKSLMESNPDHKVEIRDQCLQMPYVNLDRSDRRVWHCASSRSQMTIAKYAEYQVNSFRRAIELAKEVRTKTSESDSNSSLGHCETGSTGLGKSKRSIKFGTNVDLSDEVKWRAQVSELKKLPRFVQVTCPQYNQLSHVGHTVLGVNTVQLYMKVPGSRTPGHQENGNYCSVNINIGPGDCEWFCVPHEYWGAVCNMCEERAIDYLTGSWWPDLNDLYDHHIPLYRLVQKPGDLVFIGPGTIHWVQAVGWCNNIAWNVGPLTAYQYELAVERYEFYKTRHYRAIIPMVQLSWNLAREVRTQDRRLHALVRRTLRLSLRQCQLTLDHVRCALGKEVVWYGRNEDELTHYCELCEVEVFNVLFVMEVDRKYLVHCLSCALKKAGARLHKVSVLQQYRMKTLMDIYDNYSLEKPD